MHSSLFAQETSLSERSGTRAHSQQNKTDPGVRGWGVSTARLTEFSGITALRGPAALCLGGCEFSCKAHPPQPWLPVGPAPGMPIQGIHTWTSEGVSSSGTAGPARCRFLLLKSCVTFQLGIFPVARIRRVQVSPCSSFSQVLPSETALPCPCLQLSQHTALPSGWARKSSSPSTYTWPQRVRTGWCNTSRHTEQSKDVTGSSGSLLRSRARGVAEAGADLPLSLLSTEPIAAPLAQPAAKSSAPAAGLFCCPTREEGSPGPAAIAASLRAPLAQPGSSLGRGAQPRSRAGGARGRASEIVSRLVPCRRRGDGGGDRAVRAVASRGPARIET